MTLYYKVTKDKYELICGVADTPRELAKLCGVKHKSVLKGLECGRKGGDSQYRKIEVEE